MLPFRISIDVMEDTAGQEGLGAWLVSDFGKPAYYSSHKGLALTPIEI